MKQTSWLTRLTLLGLSFLTVVWVQFHPMSSTTAVDSPWIPTTPMTWDEHYVRLPDWSQLTFHNLPPLATDGVFEASDAINQSLGYDLSRRWVAGQSLDTVLKLGDFQTSLYLQLFNLQAIAPISQLDLNQIALGALDMIEWQTIEDLVEAIPNLGNLTLNQVPPVEALIEAVLPQALIDSLGVSIDDLTLSAILTEFPELAQQRLGQLGEQLTQFALTAIPGLSAAPLQALRNWSNSTIAGVPGLASVPFDQMPNPLAAMGAVGQIDVVYGAAETQRQQTLSGSYPQGFQVPCQQTCAHVELTGTPQLHGKQWISGQFQTVQGGEGVLAAVNGGQEPTGRHPFGEAFKVAVWDVDETTGTVSTALFFRICQRGGMFSPDLGCTPYFIGPVPFMSYRETEFLLLGTLDDVRQEATEPIAIASEVSPLQAMGQTAPQDNRPASFLETAASCQEVSGAITVADLVNVVAPPQGNGGTIGPFVCDGQNHCGRSLGPYHLMSYQPEVRAVIGPQPGGPDFLARVDSGEQIRGEELAHFLPMTAQAHLLKADLTPLLHQAQQEGLTGRSLIERVGQLYWGGVGVPVEAAIPDLYGKSLNPLSGAMSHCWPSVSLGPNPAIEEARR